jgi:hypothetical protein
MLLRRRDQSSSFDIILFGTVYGEIVEDGYFMWVYAQDGRFVKKIKLSSHAYKTRAAVLGDEVFTVMNGVDESHKSIVRVYR